MACDCLAVEAANERFRKAGDTEDLLKMPLFERLQKTFEVVKLADLLLAKIKLVSDDILTLSQDSQ